MKKKILFAASECVPFVKTGGLADVAGALPYCLDREAFDVRVIIPAYTMIPEKYRQEMQDVTHFYSYFNGKDRYVGVRSLVLRGITFYFLDNEEYFASEKPYGDYFRDIEKFAFFSKAVLSVLPSLDFRPDLIHCHDWHTGLLPVYLKTEFAGSEFYRGIKSVMTIHNLKFQGTYNARELSRVTGIPAVIFSEQAESGADGNCLKSGCLFADRVNTVSRTYAEEIKTPAYGEGLDWLFRAKADSFLGIVNGIDTELYNPATDPVLAATFDASNFRTRKPRDKAALQKEMGLTVNPKLMTIGIVSRLTEQKGFDLISRCLQELLGLPVQFVVLGTGEPRYENMLRYAASCAPDRVAVSFRYSEELSHKIYAGCDAYLMPSRFEPCGLSQLIALRYGTLPIVSETGGLKDTVLPYNKYTGEGTGFSFWNYCPEAMLEVLRMALDIFTTRKREWNRLVVQAMNRDYSWHASARRYEALYSSLIG